MTNLTRAQTLALLVLLPLLFAACSTGFQTQDPRRGDDDDDSWLDDDDSGSDDDDSTELTDDDDTLLDDDDDDDTLTDDDDSNENYEGDEPGECSDGADNDQDGLFDCDDPNCFGSPDCSGDDDTSPSDGVPQITNVTYVWVPVDLTFEFRIDIVDLDCDLTPVILWWSFTGDTPAPLPPAGNTDPNCSTTYLFDLQIVNSGPGASHSVTLSVEDSSGNRSPEYTIIANVPN